MSTVQLNEKKSFKKQLFETLYTRFDSSLAEYKPVLEEKKLNRILKRTSKRLAAEINKGTRHEKKRQEKLQRKSAKASKDQAVVKKAS